MLTASQVEELRALLIQRLEAPTEELLEQIQALCDMALVARVVPMALQAGDVLAYMTEEALAAEHVELVVKHLGKVFPGVKCVVVDGGAELQAFRPPVVVNVGGGDAG